MSVQPDTYLPAVWTLDTSTVQAIESSASDPKTRLDSTGLFLTDAAGNVIAKMSQPGGTLDILAPTIPTLNRQIRWLRSDGTVVGNLSAAEQTIGGNKIQSISMGTISPDGNIPRGYIDIETDQTPHVPPTAPPTWDDVPSDTRIIIAAGQAMVTAPKQLIDSAEQSDFLQLRTTQNLKAQYFRATLVNVPAGAFAGVNFALPTPWLNTHIGIVGSVESVAANTAFQGARFRPNPGAVLSGCTFDVNNPVLQTFVVSVISFGT